MRSGFVKIVFDYPFHIGVPDGFYPVAIGAEEVGLVQILSKEGTQIFDKSNLLRNRRTDSDQPRIALEPITPKNPKNAELVGSGEDDQPIFHIIAGEAGKVFYPWFFSEVAIIFSINDIDSAWSNPTNSLFLRTTVINFFNKFLLAYKHTSHDYYNKFLSEDSDLTFYTSVYISALSDEEKTKTTIELLSPELMSQRKFQPFPMVPNMEEDAIPVVQGRISSPLLMNVKKPIIPANRIMSLVAGGAGAYNIATFNQILLAGLERIAMDKDYRICIVDFDTAVEMAVLTYLVGALELQGMKAREIEEMLDEDSNKAQQLARERKGFLTTGSRILRLQENINILRAKKGLSAVTFNGIEEHKNWKSLVRKKRNAGVHQWEQFKKEDAEQALGAAQKFIRLIEKVSTETFKS